MNPLTLTIRGERGYVFEGEYPRTYVFVPQACVTVDEEGIFSVDKIVYFQRRWAARNMRFNSTAINGSRLFPNPRQPVLDFEAPGLEAFMGHLRRAYGEELTILEEADSWRG